MKKTTVNDLRKSLQESKERIERLEGQLQETCDKLHDRDLELLDLKINSRLLDVEIELDRCMKQFSTLNEVGNLLISSLDTKVITYRAMEAITRLMDVEAGSLLLVDEDSGELFFEVTLGEKGKQVKEGRLKIGEGIAGWVAQQGEPIIVNDVENDPRFSKRTDAKTDFITKDMLCVPIKIKAKVIGVLQAINKSNHPFVREDMDIFLLFSKQVAIALDNARLYEELKNTFLTTSEALADAIEKRDPYTGGHTQRVMNYSLSIADNLDLPSEEMNILRLSAILHDVGKIGVDDDILRKDGRLTEEEFDAMRTHTTMGADIVKHIKLLNNIIPGMLYHHERVDGNGYPAGLKDQDIPIQAKIISVADTYDAMTSTRSYRKGLPPKIAFDEIKNGAGQQFDEEIVNAFVTAFEDGKIGDISDEAAKS